MHTIHDRGTATRRPHVVVLGGGFGGLAAAHALKRAPVDVTLVDRRNFHLFQPLAYQVATGALAAGEVCYPLRAIFRGEERVRVMLAEATGVDLDALARVMAAGSGGSKMADLKTTPMRAHDYTTLFKTAHMLKDVRHCLEEGQQAGVPFPAAAFAREVLGGAVGRGYGDEDFASVIEVIEGFSGVRL